MSRNNTSLLKELSYLPWWVSVITGTLIYVALKYFIPELVKENQIMFMVATAAQNMAWLFGGLFLIPAISSIFKHKKRKQLISRQRNIETLKETSWSEFEVLVGEAFRRKGFSVQENKVGGSDGGVDLTIRKEGKLHLVQCKQWRSSKVGVAIVREMFGVMTGANAESVYVVCSGHFTKDAIKFAQDLPIVLINGEQLLELVADVQTTLQIEKPTTEAPDNQCPKCASPLVKRIAKKGANAGNEFWGCSSFPKCRYIQKQ